MIVTKVGARRGADGFVEPGLGDMPVVRLTGGQAEPDRESLRVDDYVNLGGEPAT